MDVSEVLKRTDLFDQKMELSGFLKGGTRELGPLCYLLPGPKAEDLSANRIILDHEGLLKMLFAKVPRWGGDKPNYQDTVKVFGLLLISDKPEGAMKISDLSVLVLFRGKDKYQVIPK